MSFDIVTAIEDGFSRTVTRVGGILVGLFVGLQILQTVVSQSLLYRVLVHVFDVEQWLREEGELANVEQETGQPIEEAIRENLPFAILDVPAELLGVMLLALFVGAIVLQIGAIRTFTSDRTEKVPMELFTDRIVWTVLNLIAGAILYALIVGIGTLFFVLPGIFLAVVLFFFNFEIVVEEKNAVEALSGSWKLTEGHRMELFLLGLIFLILEMVVSSMLGFVAPSASVAGTIINTSVTTAVSVAGIAIAAQAYNQLRGDDDGLATGPGVAGGPTDPTVGGPGGPQGGYGQGQPPNQGQGQPPRDDETTDAWGNRDDSDPNRDR